MLMVQVKARDADLGANARVRYMLHTGEDPDVGQLFAVDEDSGRITVRSSLTFAGQYTHERTIALGNLAWEP